MGRLVGRRDRARRLVLVVVVLTGAALGCSRAKVERNEVWTEAVTGMRFVWVPAGSFTMGSPESEPMREAQETQHEVALDAGFYLGQFEVTQAEWQAVLGDSPSLYSECGLGCPVETVSLVRIERFVDTLEQMTGERFRLPTEAEWEYACRAGSTSAFGIGESISSELANFDGSDPYPGAEPGPYLSAPSPVGTFPANAWGLYDMNGNVWEWTADEHCEYADGPARNPLARCGAELLVIRGGSWYYGPDSARCALRYTHRPQDDGPSLGFRLVRETPAAGKPS